MDQCMKFYVDGQWIEPHGQQVRDIINPATEQTIGTIRMGDAADVNRAVAAAKAAFATYSKSTRAERIALLEAILAVYQRRYAEMVKAISSEMERRCGSLNRPRRPWARAISRLRSKHSVRCPSKSSAERPSCVASRSGCAP